MDKFPFRFASAAFLGATITLAWGCGSKPAEPSAAAPANAGRANSTAAVASPSDVVSQFLDLVRRGGPDSGAGELLTARAQGELKRIGRSVQPIGSPDASFEVTRSEAVPNEENSALVHTVWSEPNQAGSTDSFQVVWAVQRESSQWRISGLALEMEPGQDPLVI